MTITKPATVGHLPVSEMGVAQPADTISGDQALAAFSALGQPTRLAVFQLLMRHETEGLSAGSIAEAIGCPQNTLSAHLGVLARAGLVVGGRTGRSIVYRVSIDGTRRLIEFLVHDCCGGHPELCALTEVVSSDSGSCAGTKKGSCG